MRKDGVITYYGQYTDVEPHIKTKLMAGNLAHNANFPKTIVLTLPPQSSFYMFCFKYLKNLVLKLIFIQSISTY
ncbi:hypothetical protein [Pseudopedobacter beijingensis]|uniref:hypothetical protein n=1 Tax=Pseudopedobacter beijingensis TaxID=1207056 RepID=UPI0036D42C22